MTLSVSASSLLSFIGNMLPTLAATSLNWLDEVTITTQCSTGLFLSLLLKVHRAWKMFYFHWKILIIFCHFSFGRIIADFMIQGKHKIQKILYKRISLPQFQFSNYSFIYFRWRSDGNWTRWHFNLRWWVRRRNSPWFTSLGSRNLVDGQQRTQH